METLKTVAKKECTTEKSQECRVEKSSQGEKESNSMPSCKINDTVENKTSIVYEDTESEVSSQIKALREKQGKKKKNKKKNATKGPSQAIAQKNTIEVAEKKNATSVLSPSQNQITEEIEDNQATSVDKKDANSESLPRSESINKPRKTIVAGDSAIFESVYGR